MSYFRRCSITALMLIMVVCSVGYFSSPQFASTSIAYNVSPLPFTVIESNTINNAGQVAGAQYDHDPNHAVVFDSLGLHDLGSIGDSGSFANGINNRGEVVGLFSSNGLDTAFVYNANGMQDLNGLLAPNTGWHLDQAKGINDTGQIVGSGNLNGSPRGFLYSNGTITEVGTLASINAINNHGQIVGASANGAFVYDQTSGIVDLGLGESEALSINDTGVIVGSMGSHAFMYDGTAHDLGTLVGQDRSIALDINNLGQVIGISGNRAFIYQNNIMADLNDLIPNDSGWVLTDARSINDAGQIVGLGDFNGQQSWFLLTPTSTTSQGSNITVEGNATSVTFSNVLAEGNTSVASILPASAGSISGGYELAGINEAYEITTTATVSGPITIAFKVPSVNDPAVFNSLRVLHHENGTLVDRTILPPDSPTHDFATRTVYARVDSLSPFVVARVSYNVCAFYDQTKAHRSGSTIPIKLQLCDTHSSNLSSPTIVVRATSLSLASTNAPGDLDDSGNANPDFNFRYVADLSGGGYVFNLNTRGYGNGTYNLHFGAGSDPVLHAVQFQVR
jgi:probable HAF family extracellular repeat protein